MIVVGVWGQILLTFQGQAFPGKKVIIISEQECFGLERKRDIPSYWLIDHLWCFSPLKLKHKATRNSIKNGQCILTGVLISSDCSRIRFLLKHINHSKSTEMSNIILTLTSSIVTFKFCCIILRRGRKLGVLGKLGNLRESVSEVFNSKFSVLYYTENRKFGVENLGVFSSSL